MFGQHVPGLTFNPLFSDVLGALFTPFAQGFVKFNAVISPRGPGHFSKRPEHGRSVVNMYGLPLLWLCPERLYRQIIVVAIRVQRHIPNNIFFIMYNNRKVKVFLYNYFFRIISYISYRISYNFRLGRFGIIPRSQPSNNVSTYVRVCIINFFFLKYSIINVTRIRVSIEIVFA